MSIINYFCMEIMFYITDKTNGLNSVAETEILTSGQRTGVNYKYNLKQI